MSDSRESANVLIFKLLVLLGYHELSSNRYAVTSFPPLNEHNCGKSIPSRKHSSRADETMPKESEDREILLAAKAVEQKIISAEDFAKAIGGWADRENESLLALIEKTAELNASQLGELRKLFGCYADSMAFEIAESIDDSFFGKLNDALADAGDIGLQASVTRWAGKESPALNQVSENRRFEILAEHARGGLGEVLLAQDLQLNRKVALKRIREKWAENQHAKSRFQLEAEITGRLEHPGVVPVYALGQRDDGEIYYAMRFIRGESLEAAAEKFHACSDSQTTDMRGPEFRNLLRRFVDVCNTIGYAHSRGIIHRDLKPANIMLGKYGETLVVDWGLAKQVGVEEERLLDAGESRILSDSGSGSAPTQFGSAVGTPQYMSPEQATGRLDRMGPLTDVFGLGATLYHLLTNQPPQQGDSVERILDRVEHGEFSRPCEVNPLIPRPLEAICLKALAVRPTERYSSPTELSDDIDRWLSDEPVAVCRDSFVVRATRWVRKHQTFSATTAVAALLLIVGGFVYSEVQHTRDQREAQIQKEEQLRLTRIQDRLEATSPLVEQQMNSGRLESVISILEREANMLAEENVFDDQRLVFEQKAARLRKLSEYRQLASVAQQSHYMAQDEDAIVSSFKALSLVGVWDHPDWWNHLPAEDLNPSQHEDLKQDVFRSLTLLTSVYTKLIALRTLGPSGEVPGFLDMLPLAGSPNGKLEAAVTMRLCDQALRFQYGEALRFFRSVAAMRISFKDGWMLKAHRLKAPRNAADAHALGIMTVTRAASSKVEFDGYRGVQDSMMSALETMAIASELGPQQYWTHLVLAQAQYLAAAKAAEDNDPEAWKLFDLCRQTYGRCISLEPDLAYAYTDLSTVCVLEHEVIPNSKSLTKEDVERIQIDLLDNGLQLALKAVELGPNEWFVHWHYGHALAAVGKVDEAMAAFAEAILLNYRFREDTNESLVDMEHIRGTKRMIPESLKRLIAGERSSSIYAALAGGYLCRSRSLAWQLTRKTEVALKLNLESVDDLQMLLDQSLLELNDEAALGPRHAGQIARAFAELACEGDDVVPFRWSIKGILAMEDHDYSNAISSFIKCRAQTPTSFTAALGLAVCYEQLAEFEMAKTAYDEAAMLVRTGHHAADVALGLCRIQMRQGKLDEAAGNVVRARQLFPACTVDAEQILAEELKAGPVLQAINESRPLSSEDIVNNLMIVQPTEVPVHNGDFELPLSRYWSNPLAPSWKIEGPGDSVALIDAEVKHSGTGALRVQSRRFGDETRALTRQTITVPEDSTCTISAWVKSAGVTADSFYIAVERESAETLTPTIILEPGAYDWRQFTATFKTPKTLPLQKTGFAAMTLYVVCTADCDVWIDDLTIQPQASVEASAEVLGK